MLIKNKMGDEIIMDEGGQHYSLFGIIVFIIVVLIVLRIFGII